MPTNSPAYRQFLIRLRQARLERGLTQVMAAGFLNRPQSYVAKCEVGDRRIDVIELEEFARLYQKPITWFLDASDPATE